MKLDDHLTESFELGKMKEEEKFKAEEFDLIARWWRPNFEGFMVLSLSLLPPAVHVLTKRF